MWRILLLLAIPFLLSSCRAQQKKEVEKVDKVGVISIYANKRLEVDEFRELEGLVTRLSKKQSFRLDTVAHLLRESTLTNFKSQLPFPLADEKEILDNNAYHMYNLPSFKQFVPATTHRYKAIPTHSKEVAMAMFDVLPEQVKAIMLIGTDFKVIPDGKVMTYVSSRIQSQLTIRVWNQKGESLMNMRLTALSDHTLTFSLGGGFQAHELRPLCIEASQKAIGKMEGYLDQNL